MMVGAIDVGNDGVALLRFCLVCVGIAIGLEFVFCVAMIEGIVGTMRVYGKHIDKALFLDVFVHEKCKRRRTWAAVSED